MGTLTGLVIGFFLLVLTSGLSFYAGLQYGGGSTAQANVASQEQVVEVEVTRIVERIVPVTIPASADSNSGAAEEGGEAAEPEQGESGIDTEGVMPIIPRPEQAAATPAPPAGPPLTDIEADDLALFLEAWELVQDNFDGRLTDRDTLNYTMIEAALGTLGDVNTRFSEPAIAEQSRQDMTGEFEGIGAFVNENEDGLIFIVRPMSGRPAALAGIESGDIIVEVDGENVVGQSLDEVVSKVRGPKDSTVVLGVAREGETDLLYISIVRARIEIPTVETELFDNGIGYVQLTQFNGIASEQMEDAVADMLDQGATSLIVDFRDNPGGFLTTAVEIADLFMPESVVLFQKNNQGLERTFESDNGDLGEEIPMVLLINGGSASASELVAGAFRDTDRATIIGELSFGKGSVQNLFQLSDGSELRVTVSRFYSPDDIVIDKVGITPDIIVENPEGVLFRSEEDLQLKTAIDFLENR